MSDAQHNERSEEEERYNNTFHSEEEEGEDGEREADGLMLSQRFDSNNANAVLAWLQSACERIARQPTAYFPNSYHQQCLDLRIRYLQGNSTTSHFIPKPPSNNNSNNKDDGNLAQALFMACKQHLLPGIESIQLSPKSSSSISNANKSIPQTSREMGATQFVSGFLKNSRLSFLGSWKRRYESLLDEIPMPPPVNFSIARVLLHVDLDAFFCSASLLNKPQNLKQQPVAVCWCTSSGSSSEISSCNYPARKSGVRAGMPLKNARELCASLVALPFDFALYEELSLDFYKTLFAFSPHVEGVSCDEAFVDVTHLMMHANSDVVQIANELRANILKATNGLTASVGCGKNKMMARLCTGKAKPNGVFSSVGVDNEEILNDVLPVSALHSIGGSTVATLKDAFQCEFVAQLRAIPLLDLQYKFGPVAGKRLFQLSRGEDDSRWIPRPERDSMSVQISWGVRMETGKQITEFFRELCEQLIKRLDGKFGNAVNVKVWRAVKNQDEYRRKSKIGHGECDVLTRTQRHTSPRTVDSLLYCVLELFQKMNTSADLIRGLGISVSGLIKTNNTRGGIAVWLDPQAKRQHVDCFQRLWDLGEARNAIEKELVFAFEVASRCPLWPDCGQAVRCCGEANRLAMRCGVVPLLRGLITCKPAETQNILCFTRYAAHQHYATLPSSHALSRFAKAGGGVVYLNEVLNDLGCTLLSGIASRPKTSNSISKTSLALVACVLHNHTMSTSANLTSLHVFRNYLVVLADGTVDASKVHSPACYSAWLKARGSEPCDQEAKRFQRALTNHLSGVVSVYFYILTLTQSNRQIRQDGRCPFTPVEEAAILKVLRRKMPWPCFSAPLTIGSTGYRSKGFHEKRREDGTRTKQQQTTTPSVATLDSVVLDIQNKKRMRVSEALHPAYLAQYTALAASLVDFRDAFAAFEIDVWPSILAQMRFVIFPSATAFPSSNNNKHKSEAYANELCEWHSARQRHDDSMVFVFDFEQQIVLAQNERCRIQFGPLQGKFCGEILRCTDLAKLTLAMAGAFLDPQNELHTQMDVVCGRLRIAKTLNVNINVDPQSSLVAVILL